MLDDADAEAQKLVNLAHPIGVALGQVIVDGDHVHAVAAEGVQVDGHGGDQGLALAGLHFRNHPLVQHYAAQELHVEGALAEGAFGRLADGGEGVDQQVVKLFAVGQALLEPRGAGAQLLVAQRLQ